jgi:hypothetical protein
MRAEAARIQVEMFAYFHPIHPPHPHPNSPHPNIHPHPVDQLCGKVNHYLFYFIFHHII